MTWTLPPTFPERELTVLEAVFGVGLLAWLCAPVRRAADRWVAGLARWLRSRGAFDVPGPRAAQVQLDIFRILLAGLLSWRYWTNHTQILQLASSGTPYEQAIATLCPVLWGLLLLGALTPL